MYEYSVTAINVSRTVPSPCFRNRSIMGSASDCLLPVDYMTLVALYLVDALAGCREIDQ